MTAREGIAPLNRPSGRFQRLFSGLATASGLFVLTVVLPAALGLTYFGWLGSDIYVSESRFIVRGPQRPVPGGFLGTLLQGSSLARSLDDAHAVHSYVLSRDALRELDRELQLAKIFSRPDIDFANRFGALDWDESFEGLHRYVRRRVSIDFESGTTISVLRVSAFSAAEAQKINALLLSMSERLVNELSERSRRDIVRYAAAEVEQAERRAKDAAVALAEFRTQKAVVDPERQSAAQLQQVAKLQEELISTNMQISQIRAFAPANPQLTVLDKRAEMLRAEIGVELAKVTGPGGSLTNKAAPFVRLALEREFAEKQLAASMALLESARGEAHKQQLYLDRVVEPNLPDYAVEPRRVRSVVIVFALGLVSWGILVLLLASVREHLD